MRRDSPSIVNQVLADGPGFLHADFGGGGAYGIPYVTVPASLGRVPVNFTEFPSESDPGPYAAPLGAPIEGGSDAHVIAIDRDNCQLFEMYHASPANGYWNAGSGATWDLRSDALRPAGWTSADAAGLPIFPGLARYDEVVGRGDPPRAALHGEPDPAGLRHPGSPLRVVEHEPEPARDGDAVPPEGELRSRRRTTVRPSSCSRP